MKIYAMWCMPHAPLEIYLVFCHTGVWCIVPFQQCGAQLPIHILNTAQFNQFKLVYFNSLIVRDASFLVGGLLVCNLAHQRSVAVLCILFKFERNPRHPRSERCMHCLWSMWRRVLLQWCIGCSMALVSASSLQDFSVPQDLCAPLSVTVEQS